MQPKVIIKAPSIFNWQLILSYLSRNSDEVTYHITDNHTIQKAFDVNSTIIIVEISYNAIQHQLIIQNLNYPQDSIPPVVINYIRDWLDLDTNLEPFYQMAKNDPLLAPLIEKFNGLRLVGDPNFYEAITWCILGQQINLAYAYTLKRRFTEKFGQKIDFRQQAFWIYPKPNLVAKLSPQALRSLHMTNRKVEYLLNISQLFANRRIQKIDYQHYDHAHQLEKELCKIRGIGPWSANYVAMRGLRYGDAFPQSDAGLLNGIKLIEHLDEKPTVQEMERLHKRWKDWSSYATFYIWRLLY